MRPEFLGWRDLAILERFQVPIEPFWDQWSWSCALPWYSHRFAILSCVLPTLLPIRLRLDWASRCDEWGWVASRVPEPTPEQRQQWLERNQRAFAPRLQHFAVGGPCCTALRQLLQECRQERMAAALVVMPEGPAFRSWYSADSPELIEAHLAALSAEFHAPVINARDWVPEEHFLDSHHMIARHVPEFAHRLAREGLLPLLRNNRPVDRNNASSKRR
jgi:hypothetical protein